MEVKPGGAHEASTQVMESLGSFIGAEALALLSQGSEILLLHNRKLPRCILGRAGGIHPTFLQLSQWLHLSFSGSCLSVLLFTPPPPASRGLPAPNSISVPTRAMLGGLGSAWGQGPILESRSNGQTAPPPPPSVRGGGASLNSGDAWASASHAPL